MTDLNKAIDFYHGLLDDEMARASNELLEEQQQGRGLLFGTRPLCTVLRPRFSFQLNFPTVGSALTALGGTTSPSSRNATDVTAEDTVTWLKGSHSVTMGGSFSSTRASIATSSSSSGIPITSSNQAMR